MSHKFIPSYALDRGRHARPVPANVVARHDLLDGSTLWHIADGSWLIDVPGMGRHELVGVES